MLINDARTSGSIASRIDGTTDDIAEVTALLANNDIIMSGTLLLSDPNAGNVTYTIDPMTSAESTTVLNGLLSMLQARLTALNASLAAM